MMSEEARKAAIASGALEALKSLVAAIESDDSEWSITSDNGLDSIYCNDSEGISITISDI